MTDRREKVKWKDDTIYDERERGAKPRIWSAGEGPFRLVLFDRQDGGWTGSCRSLNINNIPLDKDLEKAKKKLLDIVYSRIEEFLRLVGDLKEDTSSVEILDLEVTFPFQVRVSESELRTLQMIASAVCDRYNRDNPGRVMWPSGCGFPPSFSRFDAAFLGGRVRVDEDLQRGEEPTFDQYSFQVQCSEREVYDEE